MNLILEVLDKEKKKNYQHLFRANNNAYLWSQLKLKMHLKVSTEFVDMRYIVSLNYISIFAVGIIYQSMY